MKNQYYIQEIAENYLKNVVDNPVFMKVHNKFLYGLEKEDFENGFLELLSLIRNIYKDIACNPEDFGMLLKENIKIDEKSAQDYTRSDASFVRVPNLLLIIGVKADLQSDMTLTIDSGILAEQAEKLKITGIQTLVSKLNDYGFEINGLTKPLKPGNLLTFSHIDTREVVVALKAMGTAMFELYKSVKLHMNQRFYFCMMDYRLLENEKAKEPRFTVENAYRTLDLPMRDIAYELHNAVSDSTKQSVKLGKGYLMYNDWACVYTHKLDKKVLMTVHVRIDKIAIKLNLQNISKYVPLIASFPEQLKDTMLNEGWDCHSPPAECCGVGGYVFELNGVQYNKCRNGSFWIKGLTVENLKFLLELLNQEVSCRFPLVN